MTDALAQWFLEGCERGAKPWNQLEEFASSGSDEAFADFIETLRDQREIRNDDVTLVVVNG
jgi:hypothetical protein